METTLDFIAKDHMRERKVCAFIDRLVGALPVSPDEHNMIIAFLNEQLPQHLTDDETDRENMKLHMVERRGRDRISTLF